MRNKAVMRMREYASKMLVGDVPYLKEVIMVGGFFDGDEKSIAIVAERIEFEAEHNVSDYSEQTIENLNLTVALLKCAGDMVKRIDYLLNGDEDEDTFLALWADRFGVDESEVDEDAEDEEGEEDEETDEQTDA
jgi:hypothetical protein